MKICTACTLLFLMVCLTAAPASAQIAAIDFESIPTETRVLGAQIELDGDTSVDGALALSGDLTLGAGAEILLAPPRSKTLMIGAAAFAINTASDGKGDPGSWEHKGGYIQPIDVDGKGTNFFTGYARVDLPEDATVTDFRCWLDGPASGSTNTEIQLWAQEEIFPTEVSSRGSQAVAAGDWLEIDTNIVLDTSVLDDVWYFIEVKVDIEFGDSFRFFGCRVDYDVARLTP